MPSPQTSILNNVSETLLITLWAKAVEYTHPDPIIRDKVAYELINQIDYDFRKFEKAPLSQLGCCIRTQLIDEEVKTFLSHYPDGVVIQLGAGLDARYERLGCPSLTHWYDLDLPEVINYRKELLEEHEHQTFLGLSLFDYNWIDIVLSHQKPLLILCEGVLMYFEPEQVKQFFVEIADRLPEGIFVFDMLTYAALNRSRHHDTLKKMDRKVQFNWTLLHSRDMEEWHPNLSLIQEKYLSDYSKGRFPLIFRLLYKIPYFYQRLNQRVVTLCIQSKNP